MKTFNIYIFIIVITQITCSTLLAIPLPMSYEIMQGTNFFSEYTGLEPNVLNILRVIEEQKDKNLMSRRVIAITLLPYLVTPDNSNDVLKVLYTHVLNHKDDIRTLYLCANVLIQTTFDIAGGIELHQTIVNTTNAPYLLRLRSASRLLSRGIPAGYDLMVETFAGADETTDPSEIGAAMDLLRGYLYFVRSQRRLNEQDAKGADIPIKTQDGEEIDLNAVAQIIMNNTALPFYTRLSAARLYVGFDILVGYDLMREAFASDNRQWHDEAEMLFLGYVNYLYKHNQRGDTTPLYTLDGTPIDLEELAQHMTHEIVNPSVQRIINRY